MKRNLANSEKVEESPPLDLIGLTNLGQQHFHQQNWIREKRGETPLFKISTLYLQPPNAVGIRVTNISCYIIVFKMLIYVFLRIKNVTEPLISRQNDNTMLEVQYLKYKVDH